MYSIAQGENYRSITCYEYETRLMKLCFGDIFV